MEEAEPTQGGNARRPTRRQREFVIAYIAIGKAAEAAREAGYRGRYAAQAGYKLLRRKGTRTEFQYWDRLQRGEMKRVR